MGVAGGEKDYRPHRLAITPTISQATPASFLPRWGKKPWGGSFRRGQATQKAPLCKGSCPEGAEGLEVAVLHIFKQSGASSAALSVFASLSQLPYKGEPEKLSLPFIGEVSAYADGGVFY